MGAGEKGSGGAGEEGGEHGVVGEAHFEEGVVDGMACDGAVDGLVAYEMVGSGLSAPATHLVGGRHGC